jgi:hypothetical protein
MSLRNRVLIAATGVFALALGLEVATGLGVPGLRSVAQPAEAIVGRPVTPVSVAGVGRRTVRRCAAGVYNC